MKKKYIKPQIVEIFPISSCDILAMSVGQGHDGVYVEWPGNASSLNI